MRHLLGRLAARTRTVLNGPRVRHYLEIFLSAFLTALVFERQHILDAHGLNAAGSLVFACAVTAGKAVLEAYRKAGTPTVPPAAPPTGPAS